MFKTIVEYYIELNWGFQTRKKHSIIVLVVEYIRENFKRLFLKTGFFELKWFILQRSY